MNAQERLDREMKKLKDMGVTISTTPALSSPDGFEDRPMGRIAAAASRAGISEDPWRPAAVYVDSGEGFAKVADVVRWDIAESIAKFLSSQSGFPTEVRNT